MSFNALSLQYHDVTGIAANVFHRCDEIWFQALATGFLCSQKKSYQHNLFWCFIIKQSLLEETLEIFQYDNFENSKIANLVISIIQKYVAL